jgi:hypothetical protein
MTSDIKDLYVNLPIQGVQQVTKRWLQKPSKTHEMNGQIIGLLKTIMEQNYFQYKNQYFKPEKGVSMGSPISGKTAEIYLQKIEEENIKQWLDSKEIRYYRQYGEDIIIIYNQTLINEEQILRGFNKINKHLQFNATVEENKKIHFLDLTIHREDNNLSISIYRKLTDTDTTIHYLSNHPHEQKMAAFRFHINRLMTLPIPQKDKEAEWTTILGIAKIHWFS